MVLAEALSVVLAGELSVEPPEELSVVLLEELSEELPEELSVVPPEVLAKPEVVEDSEER